MDYRLSIANWPAWIHFEQMNHYKTSRFEFLNMHAFLVFCVLCGNRIATERNASGVDEVSTNARIPKSRCQPSDVIVDHQVSAINQQEYAILTKMRIMEWLPIKFSDRRRNKFMENFELDPMLLITDCLLKPCYSTFFKQLG